MAKIFFSSISSLLPEFGIQSSLNQLDISKQLCQNFIGFSFPFPNSKIALKFQKILESLSSVIMKGCYFSSPF